MNVDTLIFDDIVRSSSEKIQYGGKGINVSVILNRLSVENIALGFVGGFTGQKLEEMLRADGISCDFNYLGSADTRINVKIRSDSEFDVNADGPEITQKDVDGIVEKLERVKKDDFVVIAGSAPSKATENIFMRLYEVVRKKGAKLVVDTTGKNLMAALEYKPFLIKPNHKELGELFGIRTQTEEDIKIYARQLKRLGAQNVLVSWESKGAILIDENGDEHMIGAAHGELVSSVGCGDSMVGGFIAGYEESKDYSYALKLATACAGATAFSTTLAQKDEIDQIFKSL